MQGRTREQLHCPFCRYSDTDQYELLYHVETVHPESSRPSPFSTENPASEGASSPVQETERAMDRSAEYIECQCGEFCLLAEFESHLEMHYAEGMGDDETQRNKISTPALNVSRNKPSSSPVAMSSSIISAPDPRRLATPKPAVYRRSRSEGRKRHSSLFHDFIDIIRSPTPTPPTSKSRPRAGSRRLGRKELGPHAHEERMPEWLRKKLENGAKVTLYNQIHPDGRLIRIESIANEIRGIIPVLAQLCEQDPSVSRAFFCHPEVTHVVKMAKEGGFCGYRNIQMLISYIRDARSEGHERFPGRLPSILDLQNLIEIAWDRDFNPIGRIETGGIRGTRKYIGTPEAQALLQSLNIGCRAEAFSEKSNLFNQQQLLKTVEQYFLNGHPNLTNRVCRTSLPPIYFQHPGHSLTIVGLEIRKDGTSNLLVFDPMFQPSPGISRLINTNFRTSNPGKLLKAYRRDETYLKYSSYEILQLTSQVPLQQGWHGL